MCARKRASHQSVICAVLEANLHPSVLRAGDSGNVCTGKVIQLIRTTARACENDPSTHSPQGVRVYLQHYHQSATHRPQGGATLSSVGDAPPPGRFQSQRCLYYYSVATFGSQEHSLDLRVCCSSVQASPRTCEVPTFMITARRSPQWYPWLAAVASCCVF